MTTEPEIRNAADFLKAITAPIAFVPSPVTETKRRHISYANIDTADDLRKAWTGSPYMAFDADEKDIAEVFTADKPLPNRIHKTAAEKSILE